MRYVVDDTLPFPQSFPGWVIVTLKNGRRVEARLDASRGSREHPMSDDELRAKFEANAGRALPLHRVHTLWDAAQKLDQLPDIRPFCDLLAA